MFVSLNEDCSSEYIGFAIAAVITILNGSPSNFKGLKYWEIVLYWGESKFY